MAPTLDALGQQPSFGKQHVHEAPMLDALGRQFVFGKQACLKAKHEPVACVLATNMDILRSIRSSSVTLYAFCILPFCIL